MTQTIHWLGAGLSSAPGIKRLAKGPTSLIVWNRTIEKAQRNLADCLKHITLKALTDDALSASIKKGDIIVSMLPATMHLKIAKLCLANHCHFVSSSYISPEMQALHEEAQASGLSFVNEVGLDPGIDHLLAHALVDQYQKSDAFSVDNKLYFRSYCGGFPKIANDFKYKFSWSPLGVLKALKSPAKWIEQGQEKNSNAPWEALSDYCVALEDKKETFQAYPNRDSVPFTEQYHFKTDWQIEQFVRGTLRLAGWSDAWQPLFDEIAELTSNGTSDEKIESRLSAISKELEAKYSYDSGEADRVVLSVELEAKLSDNSVWKGSYLLDEAGNEHGAAMARLVSLPVSIAIEAIVNGELPSGVSAAPSDPELVKKWLENLSSLGEAIHHNISIG